MAGPLTGIRVIDCSERSPATAVAGMIFADLGAEVIRVEPQGGDPLRTLAASHVWLRGQKSVIVGPEQVRDGSWARLRDSADIVLDTAHPWTAKPAGLLDGREGNERQILCVLTTNPETVADATNGPRMGQPVYGELIESKFGFQDVQAGHREGPIFLGWPHAAYGAAWLIQIGVLGALYEREHTGKGQAVTTSLLDGMAILSAGRWGGGDNVVAMPPPRMRGNVLGTTRAVVSLFECGDGKWVQTHTYSRGAFDRMMEIVERPDLVDPTITSPVAQLEPAVAEEMWDYLRKKYKTRPAQEWFDALCAADVPCQIANQPGDSLWLEQLRLNEQIDISPDGIRQMGKVARFSRTQIEIDRRTPKAGEHTAALHGTPAPGSNGHHQNGAAATKKVGPLDGVLVLDFGFFIAGPFSPRMMADLGARVIKIEELSGDPMRGPNSSFLSAHRGKESLSVNLKTDEGREAVYELVRRADIVHHNMRAGATTRLAIDYETLNKINPRIIYCHSSGYGNAGPWSHLPAFEPLHSAATGLLNRTAGEGNPPLMYLSHMDIGCGLTSTVMVLAALAERERSGKGQYFEVPQIGAGLLACSDIFIEGDKVSETFPLDSKQRGHAPTNALYQTSDGWITLACYCEQEWEGLRRALGNADGPWKGFAEARQERMSASAIGAALDAAFAGMTTLEAQRRLDAEGVPCTVPTPLDQQRFLVEPQLHDLGVVVLENHPELGTIWETGHTIRFGGSTERHARPAPVIGQNTAAILREIGRTDAQIAALLEHQVVRAADWREPVAT